MLHHASGDENMLHETCTNMRGSYFPDENEDESMCHSIMKACSVHILHGNLQSISYTTHWLLRWLKKGIL